MTFLGLVRKNLFRKKLRTFLTTFAIFIAFMILGVLAIFDNALNASVDTAGADRLIVTNKINFTLPMPIAYVSRVRAVDGVENVAHASWFGGYYQEPRNFLVAIAIDPAPYLEMYPEYVIDAAERETFLKDRTGLIVGKAIADQYGWKPGDRVPIKSSIWRQKNGSDAWDFTVSAIAFPREQRIDTTFVMFHYDYFKETRNFGGDTIGWMILKTRDAKENERIMRATDELFANSPYETETKTEQAFNKAFIEQMGNLGFMIFSVASAAFGTILLITGNTMMLTVRERTNEIAVLKTIGFTAGRICALVLGESLLLALIGGLAGIAVAWLFSLAIGTAARGMFGPLTFTWETALFAFALMAALGLLTGLLPALRAIGIDVVTALGRK